MRGFTSSIRREPVGPVAQVAPWNYPMMMSVWKFAPALAAEHRGAEAVRHDACFVVLDGREDAGDLPARVCNLVCGDRDTGAALTRHKVPQLVSITGSTRAGMAVAMAGPRPTSTGPSSSAARRRSWCSTTPTSRPRRGHLGAGLFNGGQDCTAATRVIVQQGIYDEFVAALTETARGPGPGTTRPTRTSCTGRSTTPTSSATSPVWSSVPEHAG